jgi:excisionase family DNA binding protein
MPTSEPPDPIEARPTGAPWPFAEAAAYLSVSLRHLVRLADAEKVKTIRLGRRRMIPDSEVRRLATEGTAA